MARELILGIDVGTSSLKILFLDLKSDFVCKDQESIPTERNGYRVEQDATQYKEALKKVLRRNSQILKDVIAIGLSGQTPSLVAIDDNGTPTYPVMIWQDSRAQKEAENLEAEFGNPNPIIGTSLPWSPTACPAKIFWLANNQKEVLSKTRWLLQPKDYLGFLLTGGATSDPWSSKGLVNVKNRKPIFELLKYIGCPTDLVPEIRSGEETRGLTQQKVLQDFGLPPQIPVATGWSDAMSGMLAAGVFDQPSAFIMTGTSAIVGTSSKNAPIDGGKLYVIPESCAPLAVTYGPTQMSGGSISWVSKLLNISEEEVIQLGSGNFQSDIPIFLPYLAGERAPLWRSDIRGEFTGLSIEHDASTLCRAVMEGISFAERQVMEISQELTGEASSEVVLGGHSGNDPKWISTRLRTLGRKISRVVDADITCRGSAMLAYANYSGDLKAAYKKLAVKKSESIPSAVEIDYSKSQYPLFLTSQKNLISNYDSKQTKERGKR